jgi:hypothetical protein
MALQGVSAGKSLSAIGYHVIGRIATPAGRNVQSVEALPAVAAFQIALRPVAARVASEVLDASECMVALETLEGPLQVAPLRRIESACVGSRAPIYHGWTRQYGVEVSGAPTELAYPYPARSITNYKGDW